MDPIEILLLGLLGGAAYLYFRGATSPVSSQLTPGSTTSALPSGGSAAESSGVPLQAGQSTTPGISAGAAQSAYEANTSQALQTIWENAQHGNSSQTFYDFLQEGIASRMLPAPTEQNASTNCQQSTVTPGTTATAAKDVAAGAGISATVLELSPAAGPAAPIVAAVGAVAGLVSSLFGAAHARAEQEQTQAICEGWNAANNSFAQIDAGLAGGSVTPAEASSAYATIQSEFSSIMKTNTSYKTGDALWGFDLCCQAIVAARQADLRSHVLTGGVPAPF